MALVLKVSISLPSLSLNTKLPFHAPSTVYSGPALAASSCLYVSAWNWFLEPLKPSFVFPENVTSETKPEEEMIWYLPMSSG